jgi:hypothetical protein
MLLNPAIFSQISVSVVCTGLMIMASGFSLSVLSGWNLSSGSEFQLKLERRTYLIAVLLSFTFISSTAAFIYFVATAESISSQFVGAMCATGILNANSFGWPTLILKICIFFGTTVWLVINYLDNLGYDYPLIRLKYGFLIGLLPLFVFESIYLFLFFSNLNPNLIVSCCGSMFSVSAQGVAADLSAMAPKTAMTLFIGSGIVIAGCGVFLLRFKIGVVLYAIASLLAFVVALVCIISLIGPYIYEHPGHHCPFCMLKPQYNFSGVILYLPLFLATAAGLSAAVVKLSGRAMSIKSVIPGMVTKLVIGSLMLWGIFYLMTAYYVTQSNLTMGFWYH